MLTRLRRLIARCVALLVLVATFGLVRVEREGVAPSSDAGDGRGGVTLVDEGGGRTSAIPETPPDPSARGR